MWRNNWGNPNYIYTGVTDMCGDSIYVAFYGNGGGYRIFDKSTGTPIFTKFVSWPDPFINGPLDIAVDNSGIYLAGGDSSNFLGSTGRWRVEKRDFNNNILWSKLHNIGGKNDYASQIVIDKSGVYIVGTENVEVPCFLCSPPLPQTSKGRIEKRNLTTGNIIWQASRGAYSRGVAISLDNDFVYLVGEPGYIEKRNKSTGSVIWSKPMTIGYVSNSDINAETNYLYDISTSLVSPSPYFVDNLEKRNKTTGNLYWTKKISSSGWITQSLGTAKDYVYVVSYKQTFNGNVVTVYGNFKKVDTNGVILLNKAIPARYISSMYIDSSLDSAYLIEMYSSGGSFLTGVSVEKIELSAPSTTDLNIGLQGYNGTNVMNFSTELAAGSTSPFRVWKNGIEYSVITVDPLDPSASIFQIKETSGVKALKKYDPTTNPCG